LKVTLTFEPSRIQETLLGKAYELVLPTIKRRINPEKPECDHENYFIQQKHKEL
jgi:hypothetical protein